MPNPQIHYRCKGCNDIDSISTNVEVCWDGDKQDWEFLQSVQSDLRCVGCDGWDIEQYSEYTIQVEVIVMRHYIVEAESEEDAMSQYHAGKADMDESHDEMEGWEEQEHTATLLESD